MKNSNSSFALRLRQLTWRSQALLLFTLAPAWQSCQDRNSIVQPVVPTVSVQATETNNLQKAFAQMLAKAVEHDAELRVFLKTEAQKQFDKDDDILYQAIKDVKINGQSSLHERLLPYADPTVLAAVESKLPLLTVFIPTLPSGFSPVAWNAATQKPLVAVSQCGSNDVPLYDAEGHEVVLTKGEAPSFPVLVVKQNERVIVGNSSPQSNARGADNQDLQLLVKEGLTYDFIDKAFDNIHPDPTHTVTEPKASTMHRGSVPGNANATDPINIAAFNSNGTDPNINWQRDYVYYGITPTNQRGTLNRNYRESIRTLKFSATAFGVMSDQSEDPRPQPNGTLYNVNGPMWTEGRFELRISVLINAKNGAGTEYKRLISVAPSQLFDVSYTTKPFSPFFPGYYVTTGYTIYPKEADVNIDLVPWDLDSYGSAWKFVFFEVDASGTESYTTSNSSTYGGNFELSLSLGDKVKVGGKLGASASTTSSSSHTLTKNLGDDFLGEAILTFDRPVIVHYALPYGLDEYFTEEISTGGQYSYVSASVEPMRF